MEHNLRLTASIGIILFQENDDLDELMKYADTAMYNSKEKGRNRFSYFDPKLQKMIEEKIQLIEELKNAIEKNELVLHYQKQIITKNNESSIIGVEALIRWKQGNKFIPPNSFIGIAEETGLIF